METRAIVGLFIGDRSEKGLRDSIPKIYHDFATCYTDFWEAYACIIPEKSHHAVGKASGKTLNA